MKSDFVVAINQVCAERGLSKEVVLKAVEEALVSAYRKDFGHAVDITVELNNRTGQAHVYAEKQVVAIVEDEQTEISLADAQQLHGDHVQLGEKVRIEVTPKDFGRIATQAAKQAVLQRIKGAERDALYHQYVEREHEIINGTVQHVDHRSGLVRLSLGKVEAILPKSEQIPGERYRIGQRVRAYVYDVQKEGSRGPQVSVSRTRREMLRRLLELEVPEIFNGTVEIKAIAREAGQRSKVAVHALQEGIDPVGACVGMKGTRIQSVVNELNGEKIDVVQWSADPAVFVANALSPARAVDVYLDEEHEEGRTAIVVVPDRLLSLAIGKEGQNARLAAKLTGWRIDIKSASEAAEEAVRLSEERRRREEERQAQRAEEERRLQAARELIAIAKAAEEGEPEAAEAAVAPEAPTAAEPEKEEAEEREVAAEPEVPEQEKAPPKEEEPEPVQPEPTIPAWIRSAITAKEDKAKFQDLLMEDIQERERKARKQKRRRTANWQEDLARWKDEHYLDDEDLLDLPDTDDEDEG
jgi:N utilization substance protein A